MIFINQIAEILELNESDKQKMRNNKFNIINL